MADKTWHGPDTNREEKSLSDDVMCASAVAGGHAVPQLVEAPQIGRSRVRFPMVSLEFFIAITLPTALWPRG